MVINSGIGLEAGQDWGVWGPRPQEGLLRHLLWPIPRSLDIEAWGLTPAPEAWPEGALVSGNYFLH